jgi:CRP-like cAMP-binding protein
MNEAEQKARDTLASIPFFAEALDAEHINELASRVLTRNFAGGAALMREDDLGHDMYVIIAGKVDVTVRDEPKPVATLGPGEIVGEMSLLTGATRSATVTATEPVVALEIGKNALAPILASSPRLVEEFAKTLEKRQLALDRLYGGAAWGMLRLGREELLRLIRAFFANTI